MNVPQPVQFPDIGNPAINISLTAGKLNEVIAFLQEKFPDSEVMVDISICDHANSYQMKPGLWKCKVCKKVYKI
jgi:hypothetical protein